MDIELVTDPDACMMYIVSRTTCKPGWEHIVAAPAYSLFIFLLIMGKKIDMGQELPAQFPQKKAPLQDSTG